MDMEKAELVSNLMETFWLWLLIAFVAGEALGLVIAAIVSGWYDKIMKIKSRQRGNADGSVERSSH